MPRRHLPFLFLCLTLLAGCGSAGGGEPQDAGPVVSLGALDLLGADLTPAFEAGTALYAAEIPHLQTMVMLTTTASSAGDTIRVDGVPVVSGTQTSLVLEVGPNPVAITVLGADGVTAATYDVVITRATAAEFGQQFLKASGGERGNEFGSEVAIEGDTLVVSAASEHGNKLGEQDQGVFTRSGAVYVFTRGAAGWAQQAYLKSSDPGENDSFGESIGISGDTIVVGAKQGDDDSSDGAIYVFTRAGSTWTQESYLQASNAHEDDSFGGSVAISGDTIVVGAVGEASSPAGGQDDNSLAGSGAVYVFTRTGTTWSQQAFLKAPNADAGDLFGGAVALCGETLVVGAVREDGNRVDGPLDNTVASTGAAYVFKRAGTTWTSEGYLKASSPAPGDAFGHAVAIHQDTIVIGARAESRNANGEPDDGGFLSGAAYVFVRTASTWTQQAYLKASTVGAQDAFGRSVAVHGETIVVGAVGEDSSAAGGPLDNSMPEAGAAYVFTRSGSTWVHDAFLKALGADAQDRFGEGTAIWGDTVVVGAPIEASARAAGPDDNSAFATGAVYVIR